MPRLILVMTMLSALIMTGSAWAQSGSNSDFKDNVKTTVHDAVNASKDFFSGVVEGISGERAKKDPFAPDRIVASKADLARLLKVEVQKAQELSKGNWQLTVALNNKGEDPVLVTNLANLGNVVVIDRDGYSHQLPNLAEQGQDVVCLGRSATRVRFIFNDLESRPGTLRLFNTDFSVPRW